MTLFVTRANCSFAASSNPAINFRLKHGQWQAARVENLRMEGADVKIIAQCAFGPFAQFLNLQRAHLIRQCLRRDGDIPFYLCNHFRARHPAVFEHEINRLIARPAF